MIARERITSLPVRAESIPRELRARRQWVNWRLEKRGDKSTKVPYTPDTGRKASSTDPMTWGTFDKAIDVLEDYDGVGFVFCSMDPYTGIDLDHCRDPQTGEIEPWAQRIVEALASYSEVSPSGKGCHIIVKGKVPKNGRRDKVEIYSSDRFFTVTGHALGGDGD
jgi:putative DNA primase/helicase